MYSIWIQATLWCLLSGVLLYFSAVNVSWKFALQRTPVIMACHLLNFYACYSLLVPVYFEKKKMGAALLGLLILLILLTPLRYSIEKQFLQFRLVRSGLLARRGLIAIIIISELTIAGFAALLRLAVSNIRDKQRLDNLQKLQLETELRFLKMQMSPHFLFNTINNIYSLSMIKSDKAPEALLKLSSLLRYLLYECHEKVTLQKEVEALHLYCNLFQLRYEQPLNINIEDNTQRKKQALLEPLLLIPLLENSLKHSGLGLKPDAYAKIVLEEESDLLIVTFTNSVSEVPVADDVGGIGLQNIRKRLDLQYPGNYQFDIVTDRQQFTVILKLPVS